MQRFSKKRAAIYNCLCRTDRHPTADWIHRQLVAEFPDLSLGTVYRNLAQMKEAGLIQSLGTVAGQERFDGDTRPHSHLVCTGCGAVEDLPSQWAPASLLSEAGRETGWSVSGASLRVTGLCPRCRGNLS